MNFFPALVSQNKGNFFFLFLCGKDVFLSNVVSVDAEVLSFRMNMPITRFNVSKFILSLFSFYYLRYFTWGLVINITLFPVPMPDTIQGAKKVIFTACHSCHSLAQTSFQLAPKTF